MYLGRLTYVMKIKLDNSYLDMCSTDNVFSIYLYHNKKKSPSRLVAMLVPNMLSHLTNMCCLISRKGQCLPTSSRQVLSLTQTKVAR